MALSEAGGALIYPCIFCKTDFEKVEDLDKHVEICYINQKKKVTDVDCKETTTIKRKCDTEKVDKSAFDKQNCVFEKPPIKENSRKNKRKIKRMAKQEIKSEVKQHDFVKLEPTENDDNMDLTNISKETVTEKNDTLTTTKTRYDWQPFYSREDDKFRCVACLMQFRGLHQTIKHLSSSSCGEGVQRQPMGVRRCRKNNGKKKRMARQ